MEAGLGLFVICCMSLLSPFYGVKDGELRGCPPSPNCVSSQSFPYWIHYTEALRYKTSRKEAYQRLYAFMENSENIHIDEAREGSYIRVTFFTKVFRFPDRVELYLPEESPDLVQVRSHSWIGFWDVFANRIRVAKLQKALDETNPMKKDAILF